jgi:hypothetical protein
MDFDFDLKNDLVFTTDKNGILKGGGFVINSGLLTDTINKSSVNNEQTGGGSMNVSSVSKNVSNIFKDLAVPAGLFFTQKQIQKNNTIRYEHREDIVDDGLYDKLLNMLEPNKRMLHIRKTKRKREIKNKKNTRKAIH